jgi:hypothetical protein
MSKNINHQSNLLHSKTKKRRKKDASKDRLDPDSHQSDKLDSDPDPHQLEDDKP